MVERPGNKTLCHTWCLVNDEVYLNIACLIACLCIWQHVYCVADSSGPSGEHKHVYNLLFLVSTQTREQEIRHCINNPTITSLSPGLTLDKSPCDHRADCSEGKKVSPINPTYMSVIYVTVRESQSIWRDLWKHRKNMQARQERPQLGIQPRTCCEVTYHCMRNQTWHVEQKKTFRWLIFKV